MKNITIVGGFSDYNPNRSYAVESPFLYYEGNTFGDLPSLLGSANGKSVKYAPSDHEAPPYVCYALKTLLWQNRIESEMVFYLDLEDERRKKFLNSETDVVLLSTTLITDSGLLAVAAKQIKAEAPNACIICGGPMLDRSWLVRKKLLIEHDSMYEPCLNDHLFLPNPANGLEAIDLFVLFDPELEVALPTIQRLANGENIASICNNLPNLAYLSQNEWRFSTKISESEATPIGINWSIMRNDEMRTTAPVARSRGCPNRCRFCNFMNAKHVARDAGDFADEMEQLAKHHSGKVKFLYFCDDNFCGSRGSVEGFLNQFIDLRLPFRWLTLFDARFLDNSLADKLKMSGCELLKIGMESANDTILGNMAKPCRVAHYKTAANALANAEISLDAFFIVGYPGETEETIKSTIDNLNSIGRPTASLQQAIVFPYLFVPMSRVFNAKESAKWGLEGYMRKWKHNTMTSDEAASHVPEFMKKIESFQPLHGNIEKMLVTDKKKLAQFDAIRGDFIRSRLRLRESIASFRPVADKDQLLSSVI